MFPPLVRSLVPTDTHSERDGLGPQITSPLADASDWVNYGSDRTSVDLRSITHTMAANAHPLMARQDDWVEFLTRDGSDADAVVVFGRLP